jgi:hypothetical protein
MNPGPTRSGCADGRAPTGTLSREDSSLPGRVLDNVHPVTTDDAMRRDMGYWPGLREEETIRRPVARLTVDEGDNSPGNSARPWPASRCRSSPSPPCSRDRSRCERRTAGPALWSRGWPRRERGSWAALGRVVHPPVVPGDRRGDVPVPHHDQVAGAFALPQAGASSRSQAVARSHKPGLLKGSGPATSRTESITSAVSSGEQEWAD